ncbi:MAG: flagellar biosynthetic protein FliR [Desulfobacter postgatei]|uniref:Flagellar biosynthetic protein FliR n=1 Tax=Desulfobacter postgatei 2ac9 TaxID=879212 RepID=I5AZA9_9BACT|nr:flagellar biosynthetic protein FliR [Desulfobacter postgatei]EIM62572.1 flagellar biosynthetic protein FliR [Desulfobacter postgatei 2ac9]MDD4273811.1 flagellar biosynthetic protein FliR [Desulfobacter postgatei]MDX9964802.1 flagellar biosynthetic protein FliR [Desulfobacter postgatei]
MELLDLIDPIRFRTFMLVLARVSVFLFLFPIFSSSAFPNQLKIGLALVLALLFYTVVPVDPARFPRDIPTFGLMLGAEILVGFTLGLCLRIFFAGVQMAGELIGFQVGFSMINVMDPQSGENVSIMDQIGYWVCLIIFLVLNGHHIIIMSMIDSFELVPVGGFVMHAAIPPRVMDVAAGLFVDAVKISAPVIAVLTFVNTGFGLVAKFSPQTNVMIVAFPVKIVVGLIFFAMTLPIIAIVSRDYIEPCRKLFLALLFYMGGG